MSSREAAPKIRVKFWFEDSRGRPFFGEGTARLLMAIEKCKSISLACREIEMSYRYALHRINIAEERSGKKLVDRYRGGRAKGGAHLTDEGRLFLSRYSEAKHALEELAAAV